MNKIRIVGLTGPSGSGKSTVAKVFFDNGYGVIYADALSREIVSKGSQTLNVLAKEFGSDIIRNDKTLNRQLLAQRAFCSREKTDRLNAITHPAIISLALKKADELFLEGKKNIVFDAPLLFESKSDRFCDKIISVIAPVEVRKKRIMLRDGLSEKDALLRIKAQQEDSFYTDKSDFVINNDSTQDELIRKTLNIIAEVNL